MKNPLTGVNWSGDFQLQVVESFQPIFVTFQITWKIATSDKKRKKK